MSPRKDPPEVFVCECLKITEATVREAIRRFGAQTLQEIIRTTQAGDGCTACHPRLNQLLRSSASTRTSGASIVPEHREGAGAPGVASSASDLEGFLQPDMVSSRSRRASSSLARRS